MKFPNPWSFDFNGFEYDKNHKILFADNLAKLRKDKKISYDKLAKEINTTKRTLINYEKYNHRPTLEMACRIAIFFNVSLDYLVYGHTPKKENDYIKDLLIECQNCFGVRFKAKRGYYDDLIKRIDEALK